MERMLNYYGPTDIGSAFQSKSAVGDYLGYVISKVNDMVIENSEADFIPPVVYSTKGRVFNVDYNFLINCLDEYHDNVGIKEDFFMTESPSPAVMKNAQFLIVGLFDDYHDVVRIKQRSLDISKFKSMRVVEIKDKFYNVVLIRNGDNVKRFSAVPFSASEVKKLISDNAYNLLNSIACSGSFEQVAFGVKQYADYVKSVGFEPSFVTE